jgi:hypothetical protein
VDLNGRSFAMLAALALFACSNKGGEPPPPAASAILPPAPPRATGAMAAGLESARPSSPTAPDEEPEDGDPPLAPAPAPPEDGGVPL